MLQHASPKAVSVLASQQVALFGFVWIVDFRGLGHQTLSAKAAKGDDGGDQSSSASWQPQGQAQRLQSCSGHSLDQNCTCNSAKTRKPLEGNHLQACNHATHGLTILQALKSNHSPSVALQLQFDHTCQVTEYC